jgi:chitinase
MKHTQPLHALSHPSRSTKRTWRGLVAALAALSLASASAVAALPARVFAPYIQVDGSTSLTSVSSASGIKYFTLAFIIDDGTHHGLWEAGSTVSSDSSIAPAISNLRAAGGDVIISFGGAGGSELALGITSVSTLQSVYQGIITKYNVKALDFDIEGSALDNTSANDRRNQALAGLQAANPGMIISYTLPVDPTGLPSNAISLLNNAKSHGVNVACVNIMAMDYGSSTTPSMGQKAIDATNATISQLSANGISSSIGITPLIGKQDTAPEVFTTGDAQTVENFALTKTQVNRIAFWEVALDQCGSGCSGTSQSVWQFSHIFEPFSGGTTSNVAAPSYLPAAGT